MQICFDMSLRRIISFLPRPLRLMVPMALRRISFFALQLLSVRSIRDDMRPPYGGTERLRAFAVMLMIMLTGRCRRTLTAAFRRNAGFQRCAVRMSRLFADIASDESIRRGS